MCLKSWLFLIFLSMGMMNMILIGVVNARNEEVDALIAFKSRLRDPTNRLQYWDPSIYDPCTFFHVMCEDGVHVSELHLADAKLSGPLAPELGSLQYLRYIYLNGNDFRGTIPPELGNLKHLDLLMLNHNNLVGPIPTSFANLRLLRVLFLQDNHLSGSVPKGVSSLPNLRVFNYTNNNIHP